MSRAFILPLPADLVSEVLKHFKENESDYSRNLVVFPGKRPGHFLRKALAGRIGHAFIAPRIFSIDSFVEYLYVDKLGLAHRELHPVDAVAILHEIYLKSPHRFGGTSFDSLDGFLTLGLKLFGELEELKMVNLHGRKLDEALSSVSVGNTQPLNRVYDAFYQRVNELGYCTRALKYAVVSDFFIEGHLSEFDSIVVAGFFALTNTERTIFQKLKRMDPVIFLFQQGVGLGKHLQLWGLKPKQEPGEPDAEQTQTHFYQSPDSHGQVFALGDRIRRRSSTDVALDERTVIVLPASETLLPLYHQALALLPEDGYNISLGYPVARTPVYGFLLSMVDLISSVHEGKFYAPAYMKFVLHPYTKNLLLEGRSDVTRILFHTIEEYFAGEKSRTYFSLEELEQEMELFSDVATRVATLGIPCSSAMMRSHLAAIHNNTVRKLMDARTMGQLAQHFIGVLTYIDEQSTARTHPLFRPYVETLIEAMDAVATSLLASVVTDDQAQAATFIVRCAADAQVPFPGTPLRGLQVLGFLETRNLKFDTVYILDVNEDTLPGSGSQYTIIPQHIREKLGLPTSREREEISAYYFDTLVKGAREVHLFFSENAWKEKSRFVEQLLWDRQKAEDTDESDKFIHSVGYNFWLANPRPACVQKSESVIEFLKGYTYHATALDTYLRCELKFYYRYVMGLEEKEEVAGDIDSGDVGSFIHYVLREFFKEQIGKRLMPEHLDLSNLDAVLDKQFPDWFGEEKTGAKHVMRQQIRKQLGRFIRDYQLPLIKRGPVTLLELESKVKRMEKNGFVFSGKLDRVEQRGNQVFILDYKTGGDEKRLGIDLKKLVVDQRETWRDAIGSLQLPMYVMLYSELRKLSVDNIVPAYLLLGRNRIDEKIEVRMWDEGVRAGDVHSRLEGIIFSLLNEIANRSIPFHPTEDIQGQCPHCPFTTICGTGWVKMRRN